MTIGLKSRYLLLAVFLLSLNACSSSDSDSPDTDNASDVNDDPIGQGPLVPTEETPPAADPVDETPAEPVDPPIDDPAQQPEPEEGVPNGEEPDPDSQPTDGGGDQAPADNPPLTPPTAPGADPVDETPAEPADPPIDDPAQQPEPEEADPVGDDPVTVLLPPVTSGSDLDRLVQGLSRQTALTLLNLNELIFSMGQVELTAQQEACLGSFEEGHGVALIAIDCGERRLATGNNPMRVGIASFYDTPECRNALLILSSEGCVLQQLSLTIGAEFGSGDAGPPPLLFPGAELNYAIGDTSLHIDSDSEFLAGAFSCDVDLETIAVSSEFTGANCDNTVKIMADQIEKNQSL